MPDCGLGGFFGLRTPRDIFGKMERDFEQLKANRADSDAAFNFFVTAHHIVDWLARGDRDQMKALRRDALPRICRHLANGAKHFRLDQTHDSVQHADAIPSPFAEGRFSCGFAGAWLAVDLAPCESRALKVPTRIDALTLAEKVLDHWRGRLGD